MPSNAWRGGRPAIAQVWGPPAVVDVWTRPVWYQRRADALRHRYVAFYPAVVSADPPVREPARRLMPAVRSATGKIADACIETVDASAKARLQAESFVGTRAEKPPWR